jgi:hypothetical protein
MPCSAAVLDFENSSTSINISNWKIIPKRITPVKWRQWAKEPNIELSSFHATAQGSAAGAFLPRRML